MLAALALAGATAAARAEPALESAVKAAYLARLPGFVDWPGRPARGGPPLVLCLLGDGPVAQDVRRGVGFGREPRPLSIRTLDSADAASGCDILFASGSPGQPAQAALEAVRGRPVLTITDERGGQAQGMIHFRLLRGRVRFQVDVAEASRAGLSISSKLLRLAQTVRR